MNEAFQNDALAEETHTGRIWILPLLLALIGPAISLSHPHWRTTVVVWSAILVGLVALGVGAMVWSGSVSLPAAWG